MWNGTALILKARPASTNTSPNSSPSDGAPRAERRGDAGEAGRPGEAVEQRNAVEQDAAGKRAEHEIFEARLGRALVGAAVGGEHVAREAVQLEPDVERDQARRRDHDAHADRGEQDQHRIFAAHARDPRSNQPCAAMIATAAAGKMIALPKLANRSAVTMPSKIGPACDGAPIERDGRREQQRDREPADHARCRGGRRRRRRIIRIDARRSRG